MSRRLICSVATEDLPKQVEESKMETSKEIFLKDYKMPDYYFDTVSLQELFDYVSHVVVNIKMFVVSYLHVLRRTTTGGSEIFLGRGEDNSYL